MRMMMKEGILFQTPSEVANISQLQACGLDKSPGAAMLKPNLARCAKHQIDICT